MDRKLRELIDERFFGIKREREIDKKVREWNSMERKRRLFLKKYNSFGSKMRRLLVDDDGLGWSWKVWFCRLLS